ncbi:unnamed protein product [Penicillium egyptiacum]|uniref:Flavin-binding monooxygenase n=1 Tax=Penicillium egyptiacum TaxID=1303716 RepID=A0A9W4P162_9EURO|nr:unnamed protein product [Penicillium egyptiacum]
MEHPIDHSRPLRVVIIGAGISGLVSSIRLTQRLPNVTIQIYEKNADIGGTWYENRYPGCACDIPAHVYQATFEPNHNWSEFYASAKEIHQYWKAVAAKYECEHHIKLCHEVVGATWDESRAKWEVKVRNTESDEIFSDSGDILLSCTGPLNAWMWPDIPGIHEFKGKLLHSASWDESFDWENKSIAIIGNGSSGIQLVPAMLPRSARIDHYIRGKTWIAPPLGSETIAKLGLNEKNKFSFSEEQLAHFQTNPEAYRAFRKDIEREILGIQAVTVLNTPAQQASIPKFTKHMQERLAAKPELASSMIPGFAPACRRLTPGPGYLEALVSPKVNVISEAIGSITENGIITKDGVHREVDAIVCATGFNTTFQPRFPLLGRNGMPLSEKWKKNPNTYLSMMTDQFPNYFVTLGPNGTLVGSLLLLIEKQVDYITACIAKMQRENIRVMTPRKSAVEAFTKFADKYFETTVFRTKCRSWYKGGSEDGRVVALWPGSAPHALKALSQPQWEDFEYEYSDGNETGWLGDGWTQAERTGDFHAWYLDDEHVDVPRLKGSV